MTIVLCFDDSNAHGSVTMRRRHDMRRCRPDERWPGVLRKELYGADILDATTVIRTSDIDGVHFEASEHIKLGKAVTEAIHALVA